VSRVDWAQWAAEHDLSYEASAPRLIGVWYPSHAGWEEHYEDVIGGTMFGLGFWAFHYRAVWRGDSRISLRDRTRVRRPERLNPLMIKLPRPIRPDLAAQDPSKVFRSLGGRLDTVGGRAEWWSAEWLSILRGHRKHHPGTIEGPLASTSAQLAAAPPEVWAA
jgi:hypothetical protein